MRRFGHKPQVAFFDFACCEGCQLSVLQLEERLLEILEHVDVVTWREAMSEDSNEYDIAFCEGSITRDEDIERIRRIRAQADILVTLGSCASGGCHNDLKNQWSMEEMLDLVYGDKGAGFDTIPSRPISAVVDVDYQAFGCPVSLPEFVTVVKRILTGQRYEPPNQPVCVECKRNDYLCVLERGQVCLGPVTRCGCDAICTAYGDSCQGCRGLMDAANVGAMLKALTREQAHSILRAVVERHQFSEEEILTKVRVYNNWPELTLEEVRADDD
ncbi:MAG: NADH:ubiquinone oxidoreductase [Armatimonadota bacterium]